MSICKKIYKKLLLQKTVLSFESTLLNSHQMDPSQIYK